MGKRVLLMNIWKMLSVLALVGLFGLFGLSANSYALNQVKPLPADQVFQLEVTVENPTTIHTNWTIADGYYLYKKRIHAQTSKLFQLKKQAPPAQTKMNLEGEQEEVYSRDTVVPFVFQGIEPVKEIPVTIHYQGCAKQGFCYPPMSQTFLVNMVTASVTPISPSQTISVTNIQHLLTDQQQVQAVLANQSIEMTLVIFFMVGVLLAFTPCVLPMLPILTGIIAGQRGKVSTRKAFFLALSYVMGMALTYALAGVGAALLGSSIQVWLQQPVFIIFVSSLFILLGLSLFEFYEIPFSKRMQNTVTRWSAHHEGGTYVGVFFMGVLSTLIVSPCVTAPLIGVLLYVGQTGSLWLGATSLFAIGLGMGVPLLLIGTSMGRFLPKSGRWMQALVKLFGMLMIAMAIWLLSRILSHTSTIWLWGLYAAGVAAYCVWYLPALVKRSWVMRGLSGVTVVVGILLMLNAVGWFSPLNGVTRFGATNITPSMDFQVVSHLSDLTRVLSDAENKGLPVLVDFYADWCESCLVMEKNVFAASRVKPLLTPFVLLRVDLSKNTPEDQEILKKYGVIAPPTILLFNAYGKEVANKRMVGELSADDFIAKLSRFMAMDCDKKVQC